MSSVIYFIIFACILFAIWFIRSEIKAKESIRSLKIRLQKNLETYEVAYPNCPNLLRIQKMILEATNLLLKMGGMRSKYALCYMPLLDLYMMELRRLKFFQRLIELDQQEKL